jgi:hypothetical protein
MLHVSVIVVHVENLKVVVLKVSVRELMTAHCSSRRAA